MLGRSRLSFASEDVQTSQSQAIIGTPLLVPVPRKVMVRGGYATTESTKYEVRTVAPFASCCQALLHMCARGYLAV